MNLLIGPFQIGIKCLLVMLIMTGILYPLTVTVIANQLFPYQSQGSLIQLNGKLIGSKLIGQSFTENKYFWGRPSNTSLHPYNAELSEGSNYGPMNPHLLNRVKNQVIFLKIADPKNHARIPVDLVTSSASGLDPDISLESAIYQTHRVAKARNLKESEVISMLLLHTKYRSIGLLGTPRVNVLELNLALDGLDMGSD